MATGLPKPNGHAPGPLSIRFTPEAATVGIARGTDGGQASTAPRSEIFDGLDLAKCTKAKLAEFGKIVEQKLNAAWAEAAELRRDNEWLRSTLKRRDADIERQRYTIGEQTSAIDVLARRSTDLNETLKRPPPIG